MERYVRLAPLLVVAFLTACPSDVGPGGAPQIVRFDATPTSISTPGQAVTLTWEVSGSVTGLEIDQGVGSVAGSSTIVYPNATTTYTLTASNSSGSNSRSTTVTLGTGGGELVEDGLPPTLTTFGVSLTQTDFQNDQGGDIEDATDPRIVRVQPGGTFYAVVSATDPGGIASVTPFLANSSPPGLRNDLVLGQSVGGFTLTGEVGGCILDGTQTAVTCIYEIAVGNIPNIDALPDSGDEFAYVFRTRVTDNAGLVADTPPRGYVIVGESSGGTTTGGTTGGSTTGGTTGGTTSTTGGTTGGSTTGGTTGGTTTTTNGGSTNGGTTTYTLTVSKTGNGTVSSTPSGINCGGDCSQAYNAGTQVTLRAVAANGSTFTAWGGACSGSSATCQVTMSGARNVTAAFNTPSTTPTPGATRIVSFGASSPRVNFGGEVEFEWDLDGAAPSEVRIIQVNGGTIADNLVDEEKYVHEPQNSADYRLEVITSSGSVLTSNNASRVLVAPVINGFVADPDSVATGEATTLSWTIEGPVTGVRLTGGGVDRPFTGNSGSTQVTVSTNTTYTLTATNATLGSVSNSATESVTTGPDITAFTATPNPLNAGQGVTFRWTIANFSTGSITLTGPNGYSANPSPSARSITIGNVQTNRDGEFQLTVRNDIGDDDATVDLVVNPPSP